MRSLVLAALLAPAVLAAQPPPDWRPITTEAGLDPSLRGVWQSRGYGWVFEVSEAGAVGYDVSPAGCLRSDENTDALWTEWTEVFRLDGDALRLAYRPANATQYAFDRIDTLPAACATPPGDSPREVFDYLWGVMDAHYAFFDLHGVDWDARYAALAPGIRDDMTDGELFDALVALLDGLDDGHLELTAEVDGERRRHSGKQAAVFGPLLRSAFEAQDSTETLGAFSNAWFIENRRRIQEDVLGGAIGEVDAPRAMWGRRGRVGYLTILTMGGFAESDVFGDELAAVDALMNRALTDLADTDALVIDVVLNRGGYDEVSLAIAGHFAATPTLGLTKSARGAGDVQAFTVEPAAGVRYLKPVTVLTSDVTVSAAETFVMEMRALPTVTHVGGTTRGALSDILFRTLPNGWSLELSNETYRDAEGELWERRGITPDVPVVVFEGGDLWGHVAAVRGVMDWLNATLGG